MISNQSVTTIMLTRGVEDRELHDELSRVFREISRSMGAREFAFNYPRIMELTQTLRDELRGEG